MVYICHVGRLKDGIDGLGLGDMYGSVGVVVNGPVEVGLG